MSLKRRSVVYPPTVNYGAMTQRPHHLIRELARHGFDSVFCTAPETTGKAREAVEGEPGLHIEHRGSKLEEHFDIMYATWPKTHWFTELYTPDTVVYDCCDRFPSWEPFVKEMLNKTNLLICSSPRLAEWLEETGGPAHIVRNACTYRHIKSHPAVISKTPHNFRKNDRPVVGFVGAIAKWVDRNLLCKLSEEFNLVVVGPNTQRGPIPRAKNIGVVPFEKLPEYYAAFDVGIAPFDSSETALSSDPIKAWEYIAAGLPVVSTPIDAMKDMEGNVTIAEPEDFVDAIREAVSEETRERKDKRYIFANNNTWEERGRQLVALLREVEE